MTDAYHRQGNIALYHGDCLEVLAGMMDVRFSTIITDPPYGLKFMGKAWDHGVPGIPFWKRFAMLCHPGAMLLSFGGTRTWHRLAVAIEDAGWEIRDTLMYVYGSGFPKSHDISKAIDKKAGAEREVVGQTTRGPHHAGGTSYQMSAKGMPGVQDITTSATSAAKLWDGYGTSLKPSWEPILLCMAPLDGTYANNALKHGVAGINVDGGRVDTAPTEVNARIDKGEREFGGDGDIYGKYKGMTKNTGWDGQKGRWPANLILDGSEEVLAGFPYTKSGARTGGTEYKLGRFEGEKGARGLKVGGSCEASEGSAARFFYCAKSSRSERNAGCESLYWQRDKGGLTCVTKEEWEILPEQKRAQGNIHATVKPLALMEYLCKLTMMPTEADLVLDPYMGSGSTLVACARLGRPAIGIDSDEAACEIAANRLRAEAA